MFKGVLITHEEYARRVSIGCGGYAIHLNNTCILDCYGEENCLCSKANSSSSAIDFIGDMLYENARLHVSKLV